MFKILFEKSDVDYNTFVRTTDDGHKQHVSKMWKILAEKGFIKEGQHTGFYSVNEECFVMEKDLVWNDQE